MKTRFHLYILVLAAILLGAAPAQAKLATKTIAYEDSGTALSGYLAYDDAIQGQRPAILVVHEWWGLNDYARRRAEQLAGMGYVAFAVDMYGKDKVTDHPKQAGEWAKEITQNKALWQQRALAGLAVLKTQAQTDPGRMAAIGYCFGGGTVQQLAFSGADIKGVVSFHGSLQEPPADVAKQTSAKILICHGGADSFVKPEQFQAYLTAMAASGLDYQVVVYGGALHGFTNPDAGKYNIPALAYSPSADQRSWEHMKQFLDGLFGRPTGAKAQ
jgi:dienelactone hydrolase